MQFVAANRFVGAGIANAVAVTAIKGAAVWVVGIKRPLSGVIMG